MKDIQNIQDEEYVFPYHHIIEYHPNFSHSRSEQWGINYAATLEFVVSKLQNRKFRSIADIGAGDGKLVYELNKLMSNRKIVGIDYSKRAIDMAKALYPNGKYICADISKVKLAIKADAITLIEVLEHIHPRRLNIFVNSVSNLLIHGGSLFVTVPHINMPVQKKHYQHFSTDHLKNVLSKKFKLKEIRFLGKQGWQYQLILQLLINKLFVLHNSYLLNMIYKYYKKNIFFCDESECSRVYMELRKQ